MVKSAAEYVRLNVRPRERASWRASAADIAASLESRDSIRDASKSGRVLPLTASTDCHSVSTWAVTQQGEMGSVDPGHTRRGIAAEIDPRDRIVQVVNRQRARLCRRLGRHEERRQEGENSLQPHRASLTEKAGGLGAGGNLGRWDLGLGTRR